MPAGPRKAIKRHKFKWLILLAYSRCSRSFGALTPAGPSEGVKQHNGRFSDRICDVAVGLAPLTFAGPDFRYTKNSARPESDFIKTNFSGGRGTLATISRKLFKK